MAAPAPLARAVELLAAGAWRDAHELAQKEESARHRYRKADREIAAARTAITRG